MTPTLQWSEIQRNPKKVERALQTHGRVRLERRGRRPLVLIDDEGAAADAGVVSAGAAMLGILFEQQPRAVAAALVRAFPWAYVFNVADREEMARQLVALGGGGGALDELRGFGLVLRQWKNTAEAIAAGYDLSSPLTTAGVGYREVKRPAPKKKKKNPRDRKA